MRVATSGSAAAALTDADLLVLAGEFLAAPDLFDGLSEGVALYRCDGTIVTGNRASRRMVGRSAHDLVGRHFSIHVAPGEIARVTAAYVRLIETEEPVALETRFVHADGSLIDVAVRLLPARSRGRLVGVLGIAEDLTAQRQTEHALAFFNAHPDMVAMIGNDGTCRGINPAAEALLGYTARELTGIPFASFIADESLADVAQALNRALTGESADVAITARAKDGTARRFDATSIPMVARGMCAGMFVLCRTRR